MESTLHFAAISGSLRAASINTQLLKAAQKILPEQVTMEHLSIMDIPFYNSDLDIPAVASRPDAVNYFREALSKAHAIVIVSPEYNYSIPGALKNAIDWASRGQDSPLMNKPVALMGATPGLWGTVRMQQAFLPVFQFLNMIPVQKPEILIAQANTKFDDMGNLTDETAIELIKQKLEALKELALKYQQT